MIIEQNKAFIVTNCTENNNDVSQRLIVLTKKDSNKSSLEPDYNIDKFSIKKDLAYVNDMLILNTFENIMWTGTNAQNVSFFAVTPINSIFTSNFLDRDANFIVEETEMIRLIKKQPFEFDTFVFEVTVASNTTSRDDVEYHANNTEYSNCSINTETMSITIWHNTKVPKGNKYNQENDTDFMCGEG